MSRELQQILVQSLKKKPRYDEYRRHSGSLFCTMNPLIVIVCDIPCKAKLVIATADLESDAKETFLLAVDISFDIIIPTCNGPKQIEQYMESLSWKTATHAQWMVS